MTSKGTLELFGVRMARIQIMDLGFRVLGQLEIWLRVRCSPFHTKSIKAP
jgi:hypothetical protein